MLNSSVKTLLCAFIFIGLGLSSSKSSASPITAFCQRIQHYYGLLKPHDLKWSVEATETDPLPHLVQVLGTKNQNLPWLAVEIMNLPVNSPNTYEASLSLREEAQEFLDWAAEKIRIQQKWLIKGSSQSEILEIKKWQSDVLKENSDLRRFPTFSDSLEFKMHAIEVAAVLSVMHDTGTTNPHTKGYYREMRSQFEFYFADRYVRTSISFRRFGMEEFIAIAYEPETLFSFNENYEPFDGSKYPRSPFERVLHDGSHSSTVGAVWERPTDLEGSPLADAFLKKQIELGNGFLDSLFQKIRKTWMNPSQAQAIKLLLFYATHERPTLNEIWGEAGLFRERMKAFQSQYDKDRLTILYRAGNLNDLGVRGVPVGSLDLQFGFSFIVKELLLQSQLHDKETEKIVAKLNLLLPEAP